ncbi:MAG: hypothetical protein HQL69_20000 [Magnetococcales bacterium]|nr:hypothetical protein [Magnetococcales bacterium]
MSNKLFNQQSALSSLSGWTRFKHDETQTFTILVEPFVQMYHSIGCQFAEQGGILGGVRDRDLITTYYHDIHATQTFARYDPSFDAINRGVIPIWGVDLMGITHTHPGLAEPSYGDLIYADRLLNHMTRLQKFFMPIILPEPNNRGVFEFLPFVMLKKSPNNQVVSCSIKIVDQNGREVSQKEALDFEVHHINTVPSLDDIEVDINEEGLEITDSEIAEQEQPESKISPHTASAEPQLTKPSDTSGTENQHVVADEPFVDVTKSVTNQQEETEPQISQLEGMCRSGYLRELREVTTPESVFSVLDKVAKVTSGLDGSNLHKNLKQIKTMFPKARLLAEVYTPFPECDVPFSEYTQEDDEFFASIFDSKFPGFLLNRLGDKKNKYGNSYIHPELFEMIFAEIKRHNDREYLKKKHAAQIYEDHQSR